MTGNVITLKEVFERHQLDSQSMNVDVLDMQVSLQQENELLIVFQKAGHETFHRFDRFNKKYNPFSRTDFREIFLKTDNLIGGEYLAEITKEVFESNPSKYQYSEFRVSIYGI